MKKLFSIFVICSVFYSIDAQLDKKGTCHHCKPVKQHKKNPLDPEMAETLNQLCRRYPRKYSKLHTDSIEQDDFGYAPCSSHVK